MNVYQDIDHLPAFHHAVVTIGTFDGVHAGHRKILNQLCAEARKIGGETVLITFNPHPRQVLQAGGPALQLINTIAEKIELLESLGLDHLVIYPFTKAFSELSARSYVEEFLIQKFHPHTLIIGYDHHFGAGRSGNYQLLEEYRDKGRFQLLEIPGELLDETTISSTRIREALLRGEMEMANALLGYPFSFEGRVIPGNKLGRTIGYKTANLNVENEHKLIPARGVYAVRARLVPEDNNPNQSPWLSGMMNIGLRPTVGGTLPLTEVHLFDFDREIYGKRLRVIPLHYIRPEIRFTGLEALKHQLDQDAVFCRNWASQAK